MDAAELRASSLGLGVHHVGIVVAGLEEAAAVYCGVLGFDREGGVVHDRVQKVRIQFLLDPSARIRLELLEPVGESSPVAEALRKGGGVHHICYETSDLERAIEGFRRQGAVLIAKPVSAPAISAAEVAFLYDRVQGIFELVASPAVVTPGGALP